MKSSIFSDTSRKIADLGLHIGMIIRMLKLGINLSDLNNYLKLNSNEDFVNNPTLKSINNKLDIKNLED